MSKNNPHKGLKKLIDTGNLEDYEEFVGEFGKTNIRDVTGMGYKTVLKTMDDPGIFTLRNIMKLGKAIEVDPLKIAAIIFNTIEKEQKGRKK